MWTPRARRHSTRRLIAFCAASIGSARSSKPIPRTWAEPRTRNLRTTEARDLRTGNRESRIANCESLESHTHSQLNLSRRSHRIPYAAEVAHRRFPIRRASEGDESGNAEIGAVEEIEHLHAHFDAAAVAGREPMLFGERQIDGPQIGSGQISAAGVAERPGRLQHERLRTEPLSGIADDGAFAVEPGRVARPIAADSRSE